MRVFSHALPSWFWAAVCAGLLVIVLSACSRTESMRGVVLQSSDPATPFELQDQFGQTVALDDFSGQVVVLTFLYTSCRDICPIITNQLKQAHKTLGEDASQVTFVAISVDPDRDTVERMYAYSEGWGMLDKWAYLRGDEEQLSPIWKAYYIDPFEIGPAHSEVADEAHVDVPRPGSVEALSQDIGSAYDVAHSGPVYVIDRQGLMRLLFTLPIDPQDLVHDVRLLLE